MAVLGPILPSTDGGGVDGDKHQVGVPLHQLTVLDQLLNVRICLQDGLWDRKDLTSIVLGPVPPLPVLLLQMEANAFTDSGRVWSVGGNTTRQE